MSKRLDELARDPTAEHGQRLRLIAERLQGLPSRRAELQELERDRRERMSTLRREWRELTDGELPSLVRVARRGRASEWRRVRSILRERQRFREAPSEFLRHRAFLLIGSVLVMLAILPWILRAGWEMQITSGLLGGLGLWVVWWSRLGRAEGPLLERQRDRETFEKLRTRWPEIDGSWNRDRLDVAERCQQHALVALRLGRRHRELSAICRQTVDAAAGLIQQLDEPIAEDEVELLETVGRLRERERSHRSERAMLQPELSAATEELCEAEDRAGRLDDRVEQWRAEAKTWLGVDDPGRAAMDADTLLDEWEELDRRRRAIPIEEHELERAATMWSASDLTGLVDDPTVIERSLEESLQAHEHERIEVARRLGELDAIVAAESDSIASLEGERRSIEEKRRELRLQVDRLLVLERLLEEGSERFRHRHRSRILERASHLLEVITDGRYGRLHYDAEERRMRVARADGSVETMPEALSRGTRDQCHLAVRWALADQLDAERGESLPRWLDESLLQFDPERMDRTLQVLQDIAGETTVVVATCRPEVVERARSFGARTWMLEDDVADAAGA